MIHPTNNLPLAYWLLVFTLFLLFGTCLVNLDGADWDGVQIALGSIFPAAAAQGYTVLYSPQWQPLTFRILRLVYTLTHSVETCMFLPAIFGAAGLTLLLGAMRKASAGRLHLLLLTGVLLLIPELLFGAIYMNSTVFGFPFAAGAMWLVVEDWTGTSRSDRPYPRHLLSGLLLAVACLCRFEFLLTVPMFLFLTARTRPVHLVGKLAAFLAGGVVVLAAAGCTGIFDWRGVLEFVGRHQAAVRPGGVHYWGRTTVLLVIIGANLFAWVAAGMGAMGWLYVRVRDRRWFDLLVLVPLAVFGFPALFVTSPKHLVPFYMLMALFLAWMLAQPFFTERRHPSFLPGTVTVAVLLACFLPIHPSRTRATWIQVTSETWRGTDDGPRSFWGYAFALRQQSSLREAPGLPLASAWLDVLLERENELVMVAPYDGWIRNASVSQPYVFHLARGFPDMEIGPDHVWATTADKKVLLVEPGALRENLDKYFAQAAKPPAQAAIPLNIPSNELAVLRQMEGGATTEAELVEKAGGDREMVVAALRMLRLRGMVESSGSGSYRLRFHLRPSGPDSQ